MFLKRKHRLHERLEVNLASFKDDVFTDFHSLNISASGALVGSYSPLELVQNELMHVCIDPWSEYFPKPIICVANVARVAKPYSKGTIKYIEQRGEDPDIATLIGIRFLNLSVYDQQMLDEFTSFEALKLA